MDPPCLCLPRLGIVFEELIQEGGVSSIADTVHIPTWLGGELRVEGRQLDRFFAGGCEYPLDILERACNGDGLSAYGREFPADEVGARSVGVLANIIQGGGGAPFHVVVVEALEDVEILVAWDFGNEIRLPGLGFGCLLPSIDGMEGEKRVRIVDPYQAFAMPAIDYKPLVGPVGKVLQGVENVPGP